MPVDSSASGAASPRILILVENLSVPFDRRVWAESTSLQRSGFEVVVICPQGQGRDQRPYELRDGVQIHRYPRRESKGRMPGYVREYANAFWWTARLARRLAIQRPFDVVQACNPPDLLLLAAWPLKRRGAAFIFDHHDLVPELFVQRFGRRGGLVYRASVALERLSFKLADVVISTNGSFRRVALERGRLRPEDVFVVRNAPDAARFRPVAPDPSLRRGRTHLLAYVGMMGPQDGIDHALRALALLVKRRQDWRAVFIGGGDVLMDMQCLSVDLNLEDFVEFTGYVVDDQRIVELLSTADICLAPEPKNELNDASTLIKIAEYMAVARPIVAFDLRETRITAGEAATYATANDAEDYAREIDELLDDAGRREQMGRVGRSRVESMLSWKQSETALLAAYGRALERRPRRTGTAGSR